MGGNDDKEEKASSEKGSFPKKNTEMKIAFLIISACRTERNGIQFVRNDRLLTRDIFQHLKTKNIKGFKPKSGKHCSYRRRY